MIKKLMTVSSIVFSASAYSSSLYLTELDVKDVALTGAGIAARANDASTAYTNPSGMVRLNYSQYEAMVMPVYVKNDFHPDENTTINGNSNNADAWLPGASFYYVNKVSDDIAVGVAVAGYFGLGLNYDDTWVGRYYINKSLLQTIGVQPSVAYKIDEHWSIGIGATLAYTTLEQTFAMNNVEPNLDDGSLKLEDNEFSIQGNFGVLYQHSNKTRVGLQYLMETDLDFEDVGSFKNLGPVLQTVADRTGISGTKVNFGFTMPQSVNLSLYHEINQHWNILANVTWQEWSKFGRITVHAETENDINVVLNKNYDNTRGMSIGVQYQVNNSTQLSSGISYHSSMVKDKYRTPDLPLGSSWRLGFGADIQLTNTSHIKLGYGLLWLGDLNINLDRGPLAGQLSGRYKQTAMHFFSTSYSSKF